MTNQYKYGRDKELKIARSLRGRGAKVDISPGSKGAADLDVKFKSGTRWKVQVKSTRSGTPSGPSSKDIGRLKQSATKSKATPVIANVSRGKLEYRSARSGKELNPPKG